MKKILFGLSVFLSTLISAQNYPDYYPSNTNTNNGYYGDEEDSFYFPDDYYYEYPSDYYTNDFYQSSYNDYQSSIYDVNWNRLFRTYRLAPWQIEQIMRLNDSYSSYSSWNSYYRYNPDRWYYDRFYALERILGPRVFVIFQNNYYNGYNPVVYYQNYRRQHYVTNIYVVPRYRNINVNRYRVDRTQYHQTNPRTKIGFTNTPRTGNGNWQNNSSDGGFRNDAALPNSSNNNGFRNDANLPNGNSGFRSENKVQTISPSQNGNSGIRNNSGIRTESAPRRNNGSTRSNNSGLRNTSPQRNIERNSDNQRKQAPATRSANSARQRFTAQ